MEDCKQHSALGNPKAFCGRGLSADSCGRAVWDGTETSPSSKEASDPRFAWGGGRVLIGCLPWRGKRELLSRVHRQQVVSLQRLKRDLNTPTSDACTCVM